MGRARTYVSALKDVSVAYAPSWGRALKASWRGEEVSFRLRDAPFAQPMPFGMKLSLRAEGRSGPDTLLVYTPRGLEKPGIYDWMFLHPETRRWYAPDRGPFTLYAANATLTWDAANPETLLVDVQSPKVGITLTLLDWGLPEDYEAPAMLPEHKAVTHPRAKEQALTARVYRPYMQSTDVAATVIDPTTGRYYVYAQEDLGRAGARP